MKTVWVCIGRRIGHARVAIPQHDDFIESDDLRRLSKLNWPNASQVLFFFLGRHPVKRSALISERRILQIALFAASATDQNGPNSKIVIFGQSWSSL